MPRKRKVEALPPTLPRTDPYMVDAIQGYLMDKWGAFRPPTMAANLLALIVELERVDAPFPHRKHASQYLNCSVFGLDAALSTALTRELITLEVRVGPGNIASRPSITHARHFHPTEDLLSVARRSRRRSG
jgi:hypothetical protein